MLRPAAPNPVTLYAKDDSQTRAVDGPKDRIPHGNDDVRGLRARTAESLQNIVDELEAPTGVVRVPRHGSETTSPPRNR